MKKEELANLDAESALDPSVLHHAFSKLPNIQYTPSKTSSTRSETSEQRHSSQPASDSDMDTDLPSDLSASLLSEPPSSSSEGPGRAIDTLSLSATSDSAANYYSDPDVNVPANRPDTQSLRAQSDTHSAPTSPLHADKPSPPISVHLLLQAARKLYQQYPIDHPDINGAEIMGSKSCIFTWRASATISNKEAEQIVKEGRDIVLADPEVLKEEKERDRIRNEVERKKKIRQSQILRQLYFRRGATVLLTAASIVLALYAQQLVVGKRELPLVVSKWIKRWFGWNFATRHL